MEGVIPVKYIQEAYGNNFSFIFLYVPSQLHFTFFNLLKELLFFSSNGLLRNVSNIFMV